MAKNIKHENADAAVEALSKTEKFFTNHGKKLTTILILLVLAAAGGYGYYQFVYLPDVEEAAVKTAVNEQYFIAGDFESALMGDGSNPGLDKIMEEYGSKAPGADPLYAGICELQLKNWELAIKKLEEYEGEDLITKARAIACIGHAYVGLENYEAALASFEEAANIADNAFAADYLLNAGIVAEELGQNDKALGFYKKVKDLYPNTHGAEADRYIGRVENK